MSDILHGTDPIKHASSVSALNDRYIISFPLKGSCTTLAMLLIMFHCALYDKNVIGKKQTAHYRAI